MPKYAPWKTRISRAVKEKSRLGRWATTPIRRLTADCSLHTSCSPIQAWPAVGLTRVVSTPTVVDFPAPFGPSRQKISPEWISREIPLSATISGLGCFPLLRLAAKEKAPPGPAASGGGEL